MKIAVFTLTRDRLEFTKHCFATLQAKAGVSFTHVVLDNGSQDGTQEWLAKEWASPAKSRYLLTSSTNLGISKASNAALDVITRRGDFDLIVKFDNDCEVISDNILGQMVEIFQDIQPFAPQYILSPRVEGIVNQPKRVRETMLARRRIGLTAIVGGLFHVVPRRVYEEYRYPETLALAHGQDDDFCHWARIHGCEVGYVEGLIVNHYLTTAGQAEKYPDYFDRKWKEEKL